MIACPRPLACDPEHGEHKRDRQGVDKGAMFQVVEDLVPYFRL
jgi:hypothetical protein